MGSTMNLEWPRYSEGFDSFIRGAALESTLTAADLYLQQKLSAKPKLQFDQVEYVLPKGLRGEVVQAQAEGEEGGEKKNLEGFEMDVGKGLVVKKKPVKRSPKKERGKGKGKGNGGGGGFNEKLQRKKRMAKGKNQKIVVEEELEKEVAEEVVEEVVEEEEEEEDVELNLSDDDEKEVDVKISTESITPRKRLARACKRRSTRRRLFKEDSDDDDFQ